MKRASCLCVACKHCRKWHVPALRRECGCQVFI